MNKEMPSYWISSVGNIFILNCNKCNKEFNSPEELNKNEWDEWVEEGSFICSSCIDKEMFGEVEK